MKVFIDEKPCDAEVGQFILEIAQQNGIEIPALCHHEALAGQACCRVCVVEVEGAGGTRSVVVSCTYPAKEGLRVHTQSEKIRRLRRTLLGLLKEQAPEAQGLLPEYCKQYEVKDYGLQFNKDKDEKCILCGLCSKACEELGSFAIQTTMRGIDKVVAPPFNEPSETCIGCASCAKVCPTNAIECVEERVGAEGYAEAESCVGAESSRAESSAEAEGGVEGNLAGKASGFTRTIWGKTFNLVTCAACGAPYATHEELEWLKGKLIDTELNLEYCPKCRGRVCVNG